MSTSTKHDSTSGDVSSIITLDHASFPEKIIFQLFYPVYQSKNLAPAPLILICSIIQALQLFAIGFRGHVLAFYPQISLVCYFIILKDYLKDNYFFFSFFSNLDFWNY